MNLFTTLDEETGLQSKDGESVGHKRKILIRLHLNRLNTAEGERNRASS